MSADIYHQDCKGRPRGIHIKALRLGSFFIIMTALFSCLSAKGSAGETNDLRILAQQLKSGDQSVRDNAAEKLSKAAIPMKNHLLLHPNLGVSLESTNIFCLFDSNVYFAANALINADPQASRHVYIFQAYFWPAVAPGAYSRGDGLRFISPPKNYSGEWSYWRLDGSLAIKENYEKGVKHGPQTCWWMVKDKLVKTEEHIYDKGQVQR